MSRLIGPGAFGLQKVVDRFPLTEAGWASVWHALTRKDPEAAAKIRVRLMERQGRQRELQEHLWPAAESTELATRTLARLWQVTLPYLAGLEEPKRSTLEALRRSIRAVVPDAEECISYGMPAFRVDGKVVAGFAAFKNHLAYLPHSGEVLAGLGGTRPPNSTCGSRSEEEFLRPAGTRVPGQRPGKSTGAQVEPRQHQT